MLTFFRRIRKTLLGSGATGKYLLYAVGEIALVVIGILIALQINNWNTERISHSNELKLFANIVNDLSIDHQSMEDLLQRAKLKQQNHLRLYNESIANTVSKIEDPYHIEIIQTVDVVSLAFDNYRNSVEGISNEEIRIKLNSYFKSFQTLAKFADLHNEAILEDFRLFTRRKNIINLKTVFESNPNKDDIDEHSFFHTDNLLAQFGTQEFNMIVVELFLGTQDVIQWLVSTLDQNKSLQSDLKKLTST